MDSENNPNQPVETAGGAPDSATSGETPEERRARMMAEIKAKAAAKMAAKGGAPAPEAPAAPTVAAQSEIASAPPAAASSSASDAPADETPEQKRARIIAEAKAKAAAKMAAKGSAPAAKAPASETATASPAQATDANAPATPARPAAPAREVPAGTTPAARVAPGAARAGTTPTAGVAKGIPQPLAATQHPTVVDTVPDPPINKMRRRIVWASIIGFLGTSLLMFFRFFLPRAIFEPSSIFRVGFPGDFGLGVDTKYQQQYRIWVTRTSDRLFVIYARCTHLGCTPDWKASENKFKCPCHGSGYDSEGINFEGPAPRPMDRAHVELDAEGQIVVNTGRLYDWPKGGENKFNEPGAYIPL